MIQAAQRYNMISRSRLCIVSDTYNNIIFNCKCHTALYYISSVTIRYNKLHAEPAQGKTLDLILKKVKHRFVENMSSSTADALGLSRAILCNDSLLKRLEDLKRCEGMYRGLVEVWRIIISIKYICFFFIDVCCWLFWHVTDVVIFIVIKLGSLKHTRRLLRSYYDLSQTYKGNIKLLFNQYNVKMDFQLN